MSHVTLTQTGPWACGFNTLVCGSFVSSLSTAGLVSTVGWPSAFTRIGPGVCGAPIPSFCAEGGNSDATYNAGPGLGVWGYSGAGFAEDRMGTSYAAPVLAREAALAMAALQRYCASGSQPFAVTVRAFLALTAVRTTNDTDVAEISSRTLGFGKTSSERVQSPRRGTAVILWQGIIESSSDLVTVQIPVPRDWLAAAAQPVLRFFVCSDPPVNAAANDVWACRRVNVTLRTGAEARALRGSTRVHENYPMFHREYKLAQYAPGQPREAEGDLWEMGFSYEQIFDYFPAMDFDARQRVALAAELIDLGERPVDPQSALQALPIAASMTRFAVGTAAVRNPVIIRSRA